MKLDIPINQRLEELRQGDVRQWLVVSVLESVRKKSCSFKDAIHAITAGMDFRVQELDTMIVSEPHERTKELLAGAREQWKKIADDLKAGKPALYMLSALEGIQIPVDPRDNTEEFISQIPIQDA